VSLKYMPTPLVPSLSASICIIITSETTERLKFRNSLEAILKSPPEVPTGPILDWNSHTIRLSQVMVNEAPFSENSMKRSDPYFSFSTMDNLNLFPSRTFVCNVARTSFLKSNFWIFRTKADGFFKETQ